MARALELTGDALAVPPPVPKAAQAPAPATEPEKPVVQKKTGKAKAEDVQVPLQVRWPKSAVKAAKLAAVQGDFATVSDFMLACFHAYMKEKASAGAKNPAL